MAKSALDKLKSKIKLKPKTLVGKQKNLDVNKNGKVDAQDFKMLRKDEMAKGGEIKFVKTKFNSHQNHNPSADILEGHLDKDSYITYVVYIKDSGRAKAGEEYMEYYIGENYKIGSNKKSHSRVYSVDKIPAKYKKAWEELKSEYNEKYKDSMAKGGELSEEKMIQKLSKQFEGKDLWEDEILDDYEVKMFDFEQEEEMEKWKNKNSKKNYIVPFNSEDDSHILILVPKNKMADGGETKENLHHKLVFSSLWMNGTQFDFSEPENPYLEVFFNNNEPIQELSWLAKNQNDPFADSIDEDIEEYGYRINRDKKHYRSGRNMDLYIEKIEDDKMAKGGETYDKAQFKKELAEFKKHIKDGYGWISPEYVRETWENMNLKTDINNVNSPATQDLYKDLIESNMLWFPEEGDDDEKGERVKTFKDLYGYNYGENVEYAKGGYMAKGGTIAQENNEMLQSNIKEIKHHSDELEDIVTNKTEVEPWVIAKTERASTDLSDVTHYLDGEKDKSLEMPFEKGGYMANGGKVKNKFMVNERVYSYQNKDYPASIAYVRFVPYDSVDFRHPNDKYVYKLGLKDGYSNWINEESLHRTRQKEYADGGMMAKGGEVNEELKKYLIEAKKDGYLSAKYVRWSEGNKNAENYFNATNNTNKYKVEIIEAWMNGFKNGHQDIDDEYEEDEYKQGGYMAEGGEVSSKVKELNSSLNNKIDECKEELKTLSQFYDVNSTSFKSLIQAFEHLTKAQADIILFTYSKHLKPKEDMGKNGYMAEGGEIEDQYKNLSAEEIWSMWNEKQRKHFIRDHRHDFPEILDSGFILAKKDFKKLPARVQIAVEFHTEDGEYAMGGKLSFQSHQRMDELTSISTKKEFKKSANSLRYELTEDGFENDEVDKYLCHLITNSYAKGGYMAKGGEIDSEKYEAVQTINQLKSAVATNSNIETDKKVFIDGRLSNIMRLVDKAYAGLEEHEDVKKLYFYIDSATENIDEIQKELVSSKSETNIESDYITKKLEDLYDLVSNMGFNIEMENED